MSRREDLSRCFQSSSSDSFCVFIIIVSIDLFSGGVHVVFLTSLTFLPLIVIIRFPNRPLKTNKHCFPVGFMALFVYFLMSCLCIACPVLSSREENGGGPVLRSRHHIPSLYLPLNQDIGRRLTLLTGE